IFVDAAGKFPQAGVTGTVSATGARFVVGYDGRSYIEGLRPHDAVTITLDGAGRTCAAAFDYAPRADGLAPTIGPVVCK
ncbi:MAG: fimbrial biogenesis outer membrane usher protein, partial [Hyphomicrobiales bacterium]|nr:fimbrial biogenesis outer membrane usher protein [Hyphomicrobiales bacterium]